MRYEGNVDDKCGGRGRGGKVPTLQRLSLAIICKVSNVNGESRMSAEERSPALIRLWLRRAFDRNATAALQIRAINHDLMRVESAKQKSSLNARLRQSRFTIHEFCDSSCFTAFRRIAAARVWQHAARGSRE